MTKTIAKYPFLETLFIFLDHLDTYTLLTDCSDRVIYANKSLLSYLESIDLDIDPKSSKKWWKQLGWNNNPSNKNLITQECINTKKVIHHKVKSQIFKDLEYDVMCIPLKYNGVAAVLSIISKNKYD